MNWEEVTEVTSGWRYASFRVINTTSVNVRTAPLTTPTTYVARMSATEGTFEGRVNNQAMYTDENGLVWIPVFIAHERFEEHPILWVAAKYLDMTLGDFIDEPYFFDIDFTGSFPIYVTPAEKDETVVYLRALTELSKSMPATKETKIPVILEAYTNYLDNLRRTQ